MAFGTGVATISFPASARPAENITNMGSNEAKTTITGLASITADSSVEAFMMGSDNTASHNTTEHEFIDLNLTVENIVPGTGFDIVATSTERLDGDFKIRYVWST